MCASSEVILNVQDEALLALDALAHQVEGKSKSGELKRATQGIEGVSRINRVADWQVVFWKQFQFEAAGAELSATDTGVQACVQVELDINTDALREEAIPSAAVQEIVAALRSHLKHLAEHGDQA